jgi:phospholipid transport system transporter-binding protein
MSPIALPPTLTMPQARAASAALAQALAGVERGAQAVIDASALHELDTAALAVLLQAQRDAATRGVRLVVEGAPPKLRQIAALYGVESLLGLAPAEAAAAAPAAST